MAQEKTVVVANDGTEFATMEEAETHEAICAMMGFIETFSRAYVVAHNNAPRYVSKLIGIIEQYEQAKIVGTEAVFRSLIEEQQKAA